jgi:hypothetical protein
MCRLVLALRPAGERQSKQRACGLLGQATQKTLSAFIIKVLATDDISGDRKVLLCRLIF